jgi:Family of unknown function (DUF5996)
MTANPVRRQTPPNRPADAAWPSLPFIEWRETCETLHMWTQIVGKTRLAQAPMINHWWQSPLYVTSRGLTTSPIPYGERTFQVDFDFIDHELRIGTSGGAAHSFALRPQSVADFYREFMAGLRSLDIEVNILTTPSEVENPIPFERDTEHAAYDGEQAHRFWLALTRADRVMQQFRSRFIGKCSPVHFFWGGFDLAVTRFSGRRAPEHPSVPNTPDFVVREAYSHEVSSAGFWPGSAAAPEPVFYSYAYPEPEGFAGWRAEPDEAYYSPEMKEFILPYEVVRRAKEPELTLMRFLQSTYEAAADLGKWDRAALERTTLRSQAS